MSETQTYDYHPPLPVPDAEAPEASLGDCAICMDAILPARHGHAHTPSAEEEKGLLGGVSSININISSSGGGGGGSGSSRRGGGGVLAGLWNVVNGRARERTMSGRGGGGGRKNYSLAPCHHLFVRTPASLFAVLAD